MDWDDQAGPQQLRDALQGGDRTRAGRLLDALDKDLRASGRRIPPEVAKAILVQLRRYIWFDQLARMAGLFEEYAQDDCAVLVQLGQARIELGEFTLAIEGLKEVEQAAARRLASEGLPPAEISRLKKCQGEAIGLQGRAYKQLYVDATPRSAEPRTYDFDCAIERYRRAYEEQLGDWAWHGINYVALLTHRERIGKPRKNAICAEAAQHAKQILDAQAQDSLKPWDLANRIEAFLAQGLTNEAIAATKVYLESPGLDAFMARGTRRQLVEIWELDENSPPGNQILPMFDAHSARRGGIVDSLALGGDRGATYERVFGHTGYQPLGWLATATRRAEAIARIGPSEYEGHGTGFLIAGADLHPALADEVLLLTNAHVCSDDPVVQATLPHPRGPEDLVAAFMRTDGRDDVEVHRFAPEVVWTSPPSELDATLLRLEGEMTRAPLPVSKRAPLVEVGRDTRLNIIGHPKGLSPRISLQDNEIVAVDERYIHYRTPTDPGSSGSPVFDQEWNLVGLHHAAVAKHGGSNEGVRMDAISAAIKAAWNKEEK